MNSLPKRLHDHVFGKVFGKNAAASQVLAECCQLFFCGQGAKKQKVGGLLVAKFVALFCVVDQVGHVVAAVHKAAGNRNLVLVFVKLVANNVADCRKAHKDAGSVGVSQSALDVEFFVKLGVNRVVLLGKDSQLLNERFVSKIFHGILLVIF